MAEKGYYYLHTNGDLIYKHSIDGGQIADFRESTFVVMFWPMSTDSRLDAWTVLVCAGVLGAKKERIKELAEKWKCTNEDASEFAKHAGFGLDMDGNAYHATRLDFTNGQESPEGYGDTALEAITELLKELGYKADKLGWGKDFLDYLK